MKKAMKYMISLMLFVVCLMGICCPVAATEPSDVDVRDVLAAYLNESETLRVRSVYDIKLEQNGADRLYATFSVHFFVYKVNVIEAHRFTALLEKKGGRYVVTGGTIVDYVEGKPFAEADADAALTLNEAVALTYGTMDEMVRIVGNCASHHVRAFIKKTPSGDTYVYTVAGYVPHVDVEVVRKNLSKMMTYELCNEMTSPFVLSDGTKLELMIKGQDGTNYRLVSVTCHINSSKEFKMISVSDDSAIMEYTVQIEGYNGGEFDGEYFLVDDSDETRYRSESVTIKFVKTQEGWRVSGGDVFDFMRSYPALNPFNVQSPETGDENGVRAAWLGAGAVLAAAIPAVMLTVSRRKKKYNDI